MGTTRTISNLPLKKRTNSISIIAKSPMTSISRSRGIMSCKTKIHQAQQESQTQEILVLLTQPLMDYFLSDLHEQEVNRNNPLGSQGRVTQAFAQLVNMIWCESDKYIVPHQFLNTIQAFSSMFGDGSQQDSQEFLIFLLDLLHEDLNRVKVKPVIEDKDYQSNEYEVYAAESWKNYLLRNKSVVVDLFQGQLKSTLKCLECNTVSHKFDTFMYLSVPIPQNDKNKSRGLISIEDCIEEFTKEENLDRSEWWLCTKCKRRTPSTKKIDLWKTPNILIVHLKRFSYTKNNRGKINTFIDFKITQFDLSQKVTGKEKMRPIYDLFSVCNHSGNLGGGHYTAYAKNRDTQDWYLFDDSKVHYVKNPYKEIISQKAYVLFYSKTSIDKFQRQTISRPEFWPHFLNGVNINQSSFGEVSSNQKKSVSALSIQKQDSRVQTQNVLSQNNIPSAKSTPQQNGKQISNQVNIFDDENRYTSDRSNLISKKSYKDSNMAPIYEVRQGDMQENYDHSPMIKGNKQYDNFNNDSDFMLSVIAYNNRTGSFKRQQQQQPQSQQQQNNQTEQNKKEHNISNFVIKPYPLNGISSDEKNKVDLQNQQQQPQPMFTNQNEVPIPLMNYNDSSKSMFKVKRISVNKRVGDSERQIENNENNNSVSLPPLVQNRNHKDSVLDEPPYTNNSNSNGNNFSNEHLSYNNKEEERRNISAQGYYNNNTSDQGLPNNTVNVCNTSVNNQFYQNNGGRYSQNRDQSPTVSYTYHNSSMGEMPALPQNQYKIKNGQYIQYKGNNSDHSYQHTSSNEMNQSMEMNQKQSKRNGKQNQSNETNEFYAKQPFSTNFYQQNKNLPRLLQDQQEYSNSSMQNGTTLINNQNERQKTNSSKYDRFSERKSRNNMRNNNEYYMRENDSRQSQQNFLDIYQENDLQQQQNSQYQYRQNTNFTDNSISQQQQRHVSHDTGSRRNKYTNFTPEKSSQQKVYTQMSQNNNETKDIRLPNAVAAQMLIERKLSTKPSNKLENHNSQQGLMVDSSSKNKMTNTSLVETRQILAGGFNMTQHSNSSTYESSPTRVKRHSNIGANPSLKYPPPIPSNNNNNNNNMNVSTNISSTFNSAQKNYYKNN